MSKQTTELNLPQELRLFDGLSQRLASDESHQSNTEEEEEQEEAPTHLYPQRLILFALRRQQHVLILPLQAEVAERAEREK